MPQCSTNLEPLSILPTILSMDDRQVDCQNDSIWCEYLGFDLLVSTVSYMHTSMVHDSLISQSRKGHHHQWISWRLCPLLFGLCVPRPMQKIKGDTFHWGVSQCLTITWSLMEDFFLMYLPEDGILLSNWTNIFFLFSWFNSEEIWEWHQNLEIVDFVWMIMVFILNNLSAAVFSF